MSPELYNIFYESHRGSWAILIILFLVSYFLIKAGKGKAGKILHMIVRLFFVIMLITGAGMLVYWQFAFLFIVKGVLAIVLIYAMEMLLTRTSKGTIGQQARIYWIVFITCLVLVALIGYNVISF